MKWHLDVSSTEEREKILKDTATLGPWYQSFNLADWLKIQAVHDGDSVLDCMDRLGFPRDFSDKTVLDVGCNAGYYSFVAKSRGAERVVAVELDRHFVRQAQYMSTLLGLDVGFGVRAWRGEESRRTALAERWPAASDVERPFLG